MGERFLNLAFKKPFINLLMAEPTAKFLQVTHDQYAAHLGKNLGAYFDATFTDEPSLMNLWMRPQPYRVLPWSPTLALDYRNATGRALISDLPALLTETGIDYCCGSPRVRMFAISGSNKYFKPGQSVK